MDRPTAAEVRAWAPPQFLWLTYGYPAPEGPDPDLLEKRVEWAAAQLRLETGRLLESIVDPDEVAIAEQAIVLLTMQGAMGGSTAALAIAGAPWLKSFTAGSYSETRFSPSELTGTAKDVMGKINPWLPLARLLWLLATPEKREEWLELYGGVVAPAGGIFEQDVSGTGEVLWPFGGPMWPYT